MSNNDRWKLEQITDCLQAAVKRERYRLLDSLADQLTDLLIDLELEED
jgi:hypothetical protein